MEIPELKDFSLVGGTALSLLYVIKNLLACFSLINFLKLSLFSTLTLPNAITYFVNAEESEDSISLKKLTWNGVQEFINGRVSQ